jgi:hypothetical protein
MRSRSVGGGGAGRRGARVAAAGAGLLAAVAATRAVAVERDNPPREDIPVVDLDVTPEPPTELPIRYQPRDSNPNGYVLGELNVVIFGGPTFTSGLDTGGYERFGIETQYAPLWRTVPLGATFGFGLSVEQWETKGAWGIGVPLEAFAGARLLLNYLDTDTVWMTVRVHTALSLLEVDKVDDTVGGGVFAPTIGGDFTVGSPWFRLGAEIRATYRWEWQIEDRAQISMGIATVFPMVLDHLHLD